MMRKVIILIVGCLYIPFNKPMFDEMIARCDEATKTWRFECEFGVETATVTKNNNLILGSVGCKKHLWQVENPEIKIKWGGYLSDNLEFKLQ